MLSNLQTDHRKRETPDLTPKLIATDTVTELRAEFLGKLLKTEQHNVLTLIHKLCACRNRPIFWGFHPIRVRKIAARFCVVHVNKV
jgi:hypothetical protein